MDDRIRGETPGAAAAPMRVVVSGASGLIGSRLVPALLAAGHRVDALVRGPRGLRGPAGVGSLAWDPARGEVDGAIAGAEGVVHLAGAGIAEGRWTARRKALIRDSRVRGTELIARTLAGLRPVPRVLVAASAIGFYGDRGAAWLDESSPAGEGFLADVCRAWEAAAEPARAAGIRVVSPRIGVALAAAGGVLGRVRTPFRLGLGGPVGGGGQYMSWIAMADLVRVIHRCLVDERLSGPVNAVAPEPVTNRQFARTLGRVLRRPAVLPLPAFAIRLAFGEMGRTLLLGGVRVRAGALERVGFAFAQPALEGALRAELGGAAAGARP
jgi:uncharacterized protein